jgi:hypothetical protein
MPTGKRYYVSVNFVCDTDGSEKEEPSVEQLSEAFRAMLKEAEKPNVSIDFEIWDVMDQEEMS